MSRSIVQFAHLPETLPTHRAIYTLALKAVPISQRLWPLIGILLLILLTPTPLFAYGDSPLRCNQYNFCSSFLVSHAQQNREIPPGEAEVRAFRPNQMSVREFEGDHYYASIAANPYHGAAKVAQIRGSNLIKTVNGPHARKTFDALFYTEREALRGCANCEVVLSFRDGCAAIAWNPKEKRLFRALQEYHAKWRPIVTSGINPRIREIESRALDQCGAAQCTILTSICTDDSF